MKTILKIQKSILSKLTRVLMFGALICLSLKANAQCTAGYSSAVDPANNGNVTFTNTSTGTGLHYEWDLGDGTIFPNFYTPGTYTYASSGTYNVCLTVYDSIGVDSIGGIISGCSDVYCSTISVINSMATCYAYFYTWIDSTGSVSIYNASSGSITNYFWDFGDGTTSTLANPAPHTYPSSGYYTICLTTTNPSTLCNSTYCDTILVSSCSASFTYSPDTLGYGCTFNGISTGLGSNYYWNFGDGSTSTLQNPYHVYPTNGYYYVCLTVTSFLDTACYSMTCQGIYMAGGPGTSGACTGAVNPNFSYTSSSGTVYFNNSPSGSGPVYFWDFGDGTNSSVVGSTSHTYAANGIYLVCLTVYETGGGTDSCQYCNYVTVSGITGCGATMTVVQDSSNLYNYFVYYSTTTSGSATYFWNFGDGTTSTLPYPSHTYASTTPVVLCLTITDGAFCTITICDSITPGMMMSSIFTINVVNALSVSENENAITSLENYPNPLSDNTTINYTINKDANVSLVIVDLIGNVVAELESGNKTSGSYTTSWNAESVAQGMYLLQLKVNNTVSTKKIIVNR